MGVLKNKLVKALMKSPYNLKEPLVHQVADKVLFFMAEKIKEGKDFGLMDDSGIIRIISLYKKDSD